ncbi:hypothetical protein EYM_01600 [Ignicoccus islandicus DSM 13165]|uniref:Uncharacterized protein n=1 Tax=Ignicoccus islandicus DSM 13165 TaxID=940295 RepID=A0A0U2WMP5_9CREN|nr:THUMP domain-containing protein [Ignicoccus islandicus]ALU12225.1 hypothetical protein EYM_01600 [Ignicoccus islandicus DSM 13165]
MSSFNVTVACWRGKEVKAELELKSYWGKNFVVVRKQPSLLIVKYNGDPFEAVKKLKEVVDPRYTTLLKAIPYDASVPADIEEVIKAVEKFSKKIGEGETYRITLKGPIYEFKDDDWRELPKEEAIRRIAEVIDRKVDLENPDWVVYIRSLPLRGIQQAGVSVHKPEWIFSVQQ